MGECSRIFTSLLSLSLSLASPLPNKEVQIPEFTMECTTFQYFSILLVLVIFQLKLHIISDMEFNNNYPDISSRIHTYHYSGAYPKY
jgi:hypothetical protein